MSGVLIGIGVGPGGPELITGEGRDALLRADAIFVPVSVTSTADAPGYAVRVVSAHVPHGPPVAWLPFELAEDAREESWRTAAGTVAEVVAAGRTAAFATIGDPNVYSSFTYLAAEVLALVPDVEIRTVPGITAMQNRASRRGTVLVEHEETPTLLPMTVGIDAVRDALAVHVVVTPTGSRHLERQDPVRRSRPRSRRSVDPAAGLPAVSNLSDLGGSEVAASAVDVLLYTASPERPPIEELFP